MSAFGWAWLAATAALAVHVADEAAHDFLSWYNPRALRIRRALGLPFPPTFAFLPWLLGLIAGVVVLGSLVPAAFAERQWMRPLGYALAIIQVGNGLLHMAGSLLAGRRVPGVLSAPLLLATGVWLAYTAFTRGST